MKKKADDSKTNTSHRTTITISIFVAIKKIPTIQRQTTHTTLQKLSRGSWPIKKKKEGDDSKTNKYLTPHYKKIFRDFMPRKKKLTIQRETNTSPQTALQKLSRSLWPRKKKR